MALAARDHHDPGTRETHALIGSDKVHGTRVFDTEGNHVGRIERVMLEKRGNRISYAVLSFGGFFGIGDDHYPLPWEALTYDEDLGGYRVAVTREQMEGAPRHVANDRDFTPEKGREIYGFYGVPPYWV
ncbi:MAG: PRC-barrel domain-containing protein [Oricola sp.]